MFNSVRVRLTGWHVGILALILTIFSVAVYALLRANLYAAADRDLGAAIDVFARSLRHEIEEHEGKGPGEESFRTISVTTVYNDSFSAVGIAVYDGTRLVAARSGPGGIVPALPSTIPGPLSFLTVEGPRPRRMATQRVNVPSAGDYVYVASLDLSPALAQLQTQRTVMLLAIPLALAATALGGYLMARKSLAPVVAMSETVSQISSEGLHRRIDVQNPKDELGKLAATFNLLLGRLETSFEKQKQFMADSSHELRTPIYVARAAAQVTLDAASRGEAEYRETLGIIDQQLQRLSRLVEDMFLLARADAGAHTPQMAEFYLDEALTHSVRAASALGSRKQVTVSMADPTEWLCTGDEGLIRQLVMILLDNAVKYSPNGGRVQVRVDDSNPGIYRIEVEDSGPGIPQEAQGYIFDRFFRVDKARSRSDSQTTGGAGLGLAIARWIAESHGGTVSLTKSDSSGSTFQVLLRRNV